MGQYKDHKPNKVQKTCSLAITAVLTYYFGLFTFKNPDAVPCVANESIFPEYGGGPDYIDVT